MQPNNCLLPVFSFTALSRAASEQSYFCPNSNTQCHLIASETKNIHGLLSGERKKQKDCLSPLGQLVRVRDHDLPVLVVEEGCDCGVCEGGDEGSEGLEGCHPHPSALVSQQVDEQRAELCLSDCG